MNKFFFPTYQNQHFNKIYFTISQKERRIISVFTLFSTGNPIKVLLRGKYIRPNAKYVIKIPLLIANIIQLLQFLS